MKDTTFDRLTIGAGLAASLAVGIPMAVISVSGEAIAGASTITAWWATYLIHLVAFLAITNERRPLGLSVHQLLAIQVVAGAVTYTLIPEFGWSAVLLVINAATAAFILTIRWAFALVGAQTALIAVVVALHLDALLDVALNVGVYAGFQGFAMLAAMSERRQLEASEQLAEANAELRATTTLLAESSRTAERLRIARELHDLVGHQLTALALELEVASRKADDPAAEHVRRARAIAKDLLGDVRAAVGELRAPVPGLRTALDSLTGGLPEPAIHLDVADDLAIGEEQATALLRCAQEIITNTVRHAAARNLWISVAPEATGAVRLSAHDDGRGTPVLRPGNGLRGMAERIEELGGELVIDTDRQPGFAVTARVPAR